MASITNGFGGMDHCLNGSKPGVGVVTVRTTVEDGERRVIVFHGWSVAYQFGIPESVPEPIFRAAVDRTLLVEKGALGAARVRSFRSKRAAERAGAKT